MKALPRLRGQSISEVNKLVNCGAQGRKRERGQESSDEKREELRSPCGERIVVRRLRRGTSWAATRSCGGNEGQARPEIEAEGNGSQRSLEAGGQGMESLSANSIAHLEDDKA